MNQSGMAFALVLFPVLMYFIHHLSPVPFPCNAIVEVVLGLVLLNWVVHLGPRKKLSPERLGVSATCVSVSQNHRENVPCGFPPGTTPSLPIKRRKMELDTHSGV